jgi:hypothetical protein
MRLVAAEARAIDRVPHQWPARAREQALDE